MNNTWQKCPICDGTGIYQGSGTFNEVPTCPTCDGKRIISILNGKPPMKNETYGKYLYSIENCPKYEGFKPDGQEFEQCKHCGSIDYYH